MSLADEIFAGFAETEAVRLVTIRRRDGSDVLTDIPAFKLNIPERGKLAAKGNIRVHKELEGDMTNFLINQTDLGAAYTEEDPPLDHDFIIDQSNSKEYKILTAQPTSAGSWRFQVIGEISTRRMKSR